MENHEILKRDEVFRYGLLGRLQRDCHVFLGYGNRNLNKLWAGNVKEQIKTMKVIWLTFHSNKKPTWLSMGEILRLESNMKMYAKK